MLLDLFHRSPVDERSLLGFALEPVAYRHPADRLGQFFREAVVYPLLHQETVRADAGLTGIAVLGDQRPLDRGIEVGIVENDEGCIPPQLQGELFHGAGTFGHQFLADHGGAGEGDLAHQRVGGHLPPDQGGRSGYHGEDAVRDSRAFGEFRQGQRRVGGGGGGFHHHGAASSQRRRRLPGDHRRREVPGGDRRADPDRLLKDDDPLVALMLRDDVAVDPLPLLGEPLDERCSVDGLAARFGQRFPLLRRHQHGKVFLVLQNEVAPAPQDRGARLRRLGTPLRVGSVCRLYGAAGLRSTHFRYRAELLAGGGVGDIDGLAAVGPGPSPVDEAELL